MARLCLTSLVLILTVGVIAGFAMEVSVERRRSMPIKGGVVVVKEKGVEGAVCGEGWNDEAAKVVCRMQGHRNGMATTVPRGPGPVLMSTITCTGLEDSLFDCHNQIYGLNTSTACSGPQASEAGVVCFNKAPQVKLIDGPNPYEGRPVVELDGHRTALCFPSSMMDSRRHSVVRTICHHIRATGGQYISSFGYQRHQQESVAELLCERDHDSIFDCETLQFGNAKRCRSYAGAVKCESKFKFSIEHGRSYGQVLVSHVGHTGHMCSDGWNDASANALCRDLGMSGGRALGFDAMSYQTDPHVYGWTHMMVNNVTCPEDADSLLQCQVDAAISAECYHKDQHANVMCYRYAAPRVKLVDGPNSYEGRPVLSLDGTQTSICLHEFNINSHWTHQAICKSLGFPHGVVSPGPYHAKERVLLSGLICTEKEAENGNVLGCHMAELVSPTRAAFCPSTEGVRCSSGMDWTLSHGHFGEVLINRHGMLGTVCTEGWNDTAADVLCRQLGSKGGVALGPIIPGPLYDDIMVNGVTCPARASNLLECQLDVTEDHACRREPRPANALCYDKSAPEVKLVGGPNDYEGRPVLEVDGVQNVICLSNDVTFRDANARTVCRSIGAEGGEIVSGYFSRPSLDVAFLSDLSCSASDVERGSVLTCPLRGLDAVASAWCLHSTDAVRCQAPDTTAPTSSYPPPPPPPPPTTTPPTPQAPTSLQP